jgi:predicted nuclease of predicted toxin-antitoxin system
VKLVLDQNLSPRLVQLLADIFPDSTHVSLVGLARAFDEDVWAFARALGCVIVTTDADFGDLGVLRGFPPKVVLLPIGNSTVFRGSCREQIPAPHIVLTATRLPG